MMPIGDGASVANLQKWRTQEEKKSSSELLCCCASTQLMQFQGFQNHFAILFFSGAKASASPSKGRFAFLCNEAKNNYVLVFLKQESSEVYENGMLGAIYASFVYYDLQWIT